MTYEPYELNDAKRRRVETALIHCKDALPPGRMDDLEDFHLRQALVESLVGNHELERRWADERLLLTSTKMQGVLQDHILGFLSPYDLCFQVALVDTNMKQGVESYSKRHHLVETTNDVNVQYGNYLENLKRSIDEFLSIVGPRRAVENRRRTFLANLDWNISYQLKRHRPARYPGEGPRLRIRFDEKVVKRANRLAEKRAKIQ